MSNESVQKINTSEVGTTSNSNKRTFSMREEEEPKSPKSSVQTENDSSINESPNKR